MNLVKEITNQTISITEFNRGFAGRIFNDVKAKGAKVVLKNNTPECVLISPNDYLKLMDELEDVKDILLANQRLGDLKQDNIISQKDFEQTFSIDFENIDPLDESEFE